ncbi:MAG: DUF1385 domain-containing protein [Oscillospiraceae bacterium]|nr:DUF1385 domain-containing protein [Oscillospiraceae bacterium]
MSKEKGAAAAHKSKIGGQALIEGVMMRGFGKEAVAVRQKDGGVYLEVNPVPVNKWYQKALFIRGVFNFILQMKNGYKYMMKSMEVSGMLDDDEPADGEPVPSDGEPASSDGEPKKSKDGAASAASTAIVGAVGLIGGVVLAVFLFMYLPTQCFTWIFNERAKQFQPLFEGLIRIALFVGYMWVISLMKEIRVTYEYHGAEHKTIAAYEAGAELVYENVKKYTRFHPRCGTSFIFLVLAISIIFYSVLQFFLPVSSKDVAQWLGVSAVIANVIRTGIKLLFLPVLVGMTYEVIKLAGRYDRNIFMRIISAPGLGLQRLTTREPTEKQVEIAIAALLPVIPEDKEQDRW